MFVSFASSAMASSSGSLPALGKPLSPQFQPFFSLFLEASFRFLHFFLAEAVQVLVSSLVDESPVVRESSLAALREIAPL